MKICVLGAGMVGRAIAEDLSINHEVTSVDRDAKSLSNIKNKSIQPIEADLQNLDNYGALLEDFDIVVSAVPGFMGYATLGKLISLGKDVVDISFFPEDSLQLDQLAKEKNVTAITDCGVAPGMSNFLLGYWDARMTVTKFLCYVGGLPKVRVKPFEYKAPFSPIDVLEEYSRPARYVENGHIITRDALSDIEEINFPYAGTLEAFNTDGLRSLMFTMAHIPDMKEKTLRYPGHASLIKSLQDAGYLSPDPINVNGVNISPVALSQAILFNQWKLEEKEDEFTLMQVNISGHDEAGARNVSYLLYDERDKTTGISSMSRTTGYACTANVNLLAKKIFTEKGIFPPEKIGGNEACFEFVMKYLEDRNVLYTLTEN